MARVFCEGKIRSTHCDPRIAPPPEIFTRASAPHKNCRLLRQHLLRQRGYRPIARVAQGCRRTLMSGAQRSSHQPTICILTALKARVKSATGADRWLRKHPAAPTPAPPVNLNAISNSATSVFAECSECNVNCTQVIALLKS